MPITPKLKSTSVKPNPEEYSVDWGEAIRTPGGGVLATQSALRKARGKNKNPTKQQVAIRLDQEVIAAFRADGPGWQSRMNEVLKDWVALRHHRLTNQVIKRT